MSLLPPMCALITHTAICAPQGGKSFFSEIIASISDVRFSRDGRHLVSRDYMSLKVWDLAMERQPLLTLHVHEELRPRLCDLYENDSIFDKFDVAMDGTASYVASGSYNNTFKVFQASEGTVGLPLEASRDPMRKRVTASAGTAKVCSVPHMSHTLSHPATPNLCLS
jgi:serine/threonine-protein phosphatase 2A regulatory subunit B